MKRRVIPAGICVLAALVLSSAGSSIGPSTQPADQSEDDNIRETIQRYLEGTSYNRSELILSAFHEEAELFLSHPEREIWIVPIAEYVGLFANREEGKFNGREGSILSIDRTNDIAMAKAEIRSTTNGARYIDIFLLKKVQGEWKIISKAATRTN